VDGTVVRCVLPGFFTCELLLADRAVSAALGGRTHT
jgi:hypothetical protein